MCEPGSLQHYTCERILDPLKLRYVSYIMLVKKLKKTMCSKLQILTKNAETLTQITKIKRGCN